LGDTLISARHRLHAVIAGVLISSGLLAPLAIQGAAEADPTPCQDVWFVGARGSGETIGMGAEVRHMADVVQSSVEARGLTFTRMAVSYPADPVGELNPSGFETALFLTGHPILALADYKLHHYDKFTDSIRQGRDGTRAAVRSVLASCPNAQIVLGGYSQGAMAVHAAERYFASHGNNEALSHIKGTLLLADGDRVRSTRATHFGTSDNRAEGIRSSFQGSQDVPKPKSTADICADKDIVCDFAPAFVFGHYSQAKHIHTNYSRDDGTFSPALDHAARWVASLLTKPTIIFDGSPGTAAPPATLGGYSMTAFGTDPDTTGDGDQVNDPSGVVTFDQTLTHTTVGNDWETWSHGYEGDVYFGSSPITITLPPGTKAFYLYAEPNQFEDFDVSAVTGNGTTSGTQTVYGDSGASYFGFYTVGSKTLKEITVSAADDIAVGEFGINHN
jgi:hypothetical protein